MENANYPSIVLHRPRTFIMAILLRPLIYMELKTIVAQANLFWTAILDRIHLSHIT